MSNAALAIPFGHFPSIVTALGDSLITTTFSFEAEHILAVGYSSGTILLYQVQLTESNASPSIKVFAHLTGHKSAIVAFTSYETRTETGKDSRLLLSVSRDGQLCKWSIQDGRCLQSVELVLDARPRGLDVLTLPESASTGWLNEKYVIVHGCTTTITILSATTLETVVLWTSNLDWPLPVVCGAVSARLLTFTEEGDVQGWTVELDAVSNHARVMKDHDLAFKLSGEMYGGIKAAPQILPKLEKSRHDIKLLLVCHKGLIIVESDFEKQEPFKRLVEVAIPEGVSLANFQHGQIWIWTQKSRIAVYTLELKRFINTEMTVFAGEKVEHVESSGIWKSLDVVVVFRRGKDGLPSYKFGCLDSKRGEIRWSLPTEATVGETVRIGASSGASAVFNNQVVFAFGTELRFYTFSNFLLKFDQPSLAIELKQARGFVTLLKAVTLGEPEKGYLIVGMNDGSVYVVEANSLRISARLALLSRSIQNALALPHDMAPRLRSTILVTSKCGSVAVVDLIPSTITAVPKPRIMLLFPPGRFTTKIIAVATQAGSNTLFIMDENGGRRLWDIDAKDGGGVLLGDSKAHDHPNRNSISPDVISPALSDLEHIDSSQAPWRELWFSELRRTHDPLVNEPYSACDIPSGQGIPCALLNIRYVLDALTAATAAVLGKVPVDHPAIINARAVLTTILPIDLDSLSAEAERQDDGPVVKLDSETTAPILMHRKSPAALGQLGAKDHISILCEDKDTPDWLNTSPTLKSVVAICVTSLLHGMFAAGYINSIDTINSVTANCLAVPASSTVTFVAADLGVFVKYWADSQPFLQEASRACFLQVLKQMSPSDIGKAVFFWRDFLPTKISPEFFNLKEVLRSVIVLSGIIIHTKVDDEMSIDTLIDTSLRRNIALSLELFLADANESYQNAAIELIGEGWLDWQNSFDAFEVIHVLIRISITISKNPTKRDLLDSALVTIATKNSPLLVSGLGNCISHLIAPDKLATSTLSETVNLSIAAMKAVIHIVRHNPVLFSEVELLKPIVEALVKIVEPQAGILRDRVLKTVTTVVNELVDAYPTVAFHRPTQKLALSTSSMAVTIYDLRNASPQTTLDGLQRVAQYLTFSQDGRYLVAVDLETSELLVWRIASNFLASFIGAGLSKLGENATTVALKAKHGFSNPEGHGILMVEFTGERVVTVTAGDQVTSVNV